MPADDVKDAPPRPEPPTGTLDGSSRARSCGLGITTYVFSVLTLASNLVSGIVVARALGPSGRGVTVALTTVAQLAGYLFAMGVAQSLSYYIARRPQDGPNLLTTWVLMLVPLTAVAIGVAELLLPVIFVNDAEAVSIGRWFLFTIVRRVASS